MYIGRKLDSRFSVYLLDLRNHGRSPHSDEFNYEVMVEDLAEFVADHHLEGAAIIGHSLGGRIAMRFALSNPSAINRLVVVDISPQNRPSANIQFLPDVLETMQRLPLSELKTRKEVDKRLSKVVPDLRERQLLLKNLRRKEDHSFAWKANLEVIRRNMRLVYELTNQPFFYEAKIQNILLGLTGRRFWNCFPWPGLSPSQRPGIGFMRMLPRKWPRRFSRLWKVEFVGRNDAEIILTGRGRKDRRGLSLDSFQSAFPACPNQAGALCG
jgi:pimeloyl-ACP methyl ester carboxylesterase